MHAHSNGVTTMGEELDRLLTWLRIHAGWTAEIIHKPEHNAFRIEIRLTNGRAAIGKTDRYYPEEVRLMKASLWTMVDELMEAVLAVEAKENAT
jgi:hypothetical protein